MTMWSGNKGNALVTPAHMCTQKGFCETAYLISGYIHIEVRLNMHCWIQKRYLCMKILGTCNRLSQRERNHLLRFVPWTSPLCGGQAFILHLSLLSPAKWQIREKPTSFIFNIWGRHNDKCGQEIPWNFLCDHIYLKRSWVTASLD